VKPTEQEETMLRQHAVDPALVEATRDLPVIQVTTQNIGEGVVVQLAVCLPSGFMRPDLAALAPAERELVVKDALVSAGVRILWNRDLLDIATVRATERASAIAAHHTSDLAAEA